MIAHKIFASYWGGSYDNRSSYGYGSAYGSAAYDSNKKKSDYVKPNVDLFKDLTAEEKEQIRDNFQQMRNEALTVLQSEGKISRSEQINSFISKIQELESIQNQKPNSGSLLKKYLKNRDEASNAEAIKKIFQKTYGNNGEKKLSKLQKAYNAKKNLKTLIAAVQPLIDEINYLEKTKEKILSQRGQQQHQYPQPYGYAQPMQLSETQQDQLNQLDRDIKSKEDDLRHIFKGSKYKISDLEVIRGGYGGGYQQSSGHQYSTAELTKKLELLNGEYNKEEANIFKDLEGVSTAGSKKIDELREFLLKNAMKQAPNILKAVYLNVSQKAREMIDRGVRVKEHERKHDKTQKISKLPTQNLELLAFQKMLALNFNNNREEFLNLAIKKIEELNHQYSQYADTDFMQEIIDDLKSLKDFDMFNPEDDVCIKVSKKCDDTIFQVIHTVMKDQLKMPMFEETSKRDLTKKVTLDEERKEGFRHIANNFDLWKKRYHKSISEIDLYTSVKLEAKDSAQQKQQSNLKTFKETIKSIQEGTHKQTEETKETAKGILDIFGLGDVFK